MTLPTPAEIAHADALRLARTLREVGGRAAPIGSGWMACETPGTWAAQAAGLGQDGPVSAAEIEELVGFFRAVGGTPLVQLTGYQHPSLRQALVARGFVLDEIETVLGRSLRGPPPAARCDLRFHRVDPQVAADVEAWVRLHFGGFSPDRTPPPALAELARRVAHNHRSRIWLIEHEGALVGSGGLEVEGPMAVLIAGSTVPAARGRGIQQALIAFRLAEAKRQGCRYALVGSTPGGPTERNALRAGFQPVYTQLGLALHAEPSAEHKRPEA